MKISLLGMIGGVLLGVAIGGISGMVGIGGGAFLVPALLFFYGMSQKGAQGTSLAMLLPPTGIFAAWTYYKAGEVNVKLALLVAIGFSLGAWLGGRVVQHLSDVFLRRCFATVLIILALQMLFKK